MNLKAIVVVILLVLFGVVLTQGTLRYIQSGSPAGTPILTALGAPIWRVIFNQQPSHALSELATLPAASVVVISPDTAEPKCQGCSAANPSDWDASHEIMAVYPGSRETFDTSAPDVDQATGEPLTPPASPVIAVGGPLVNTVVRRAQEIAGTTDGSPVQCDIEDRYYFTAGGEHVADTRMPVGDLETWGTDYFLVQIYEDSDSRLTTIAYGYGPAGTCAAACYLTHELVPNAAAHPESYTIVKWEDTNGNLVVDPPGEGDTYSVVATG